MARQIIKEDRTQYDLVNSIMQNYDASWNNLRTWDRSRFAVHPFNTYYINPTTPDITDVIGPYKLFDLGGNTLQVEKNKTPFVCSKEVIRRGPLIAYLKTATELFMLFISKNAFVDDYVETTKPVTTIKNNYITIENTTDSSLYYSYNSLATNADLYIIAPKQTQTLSPSNAGYLYLQLEDTPIAITSSNTRTKSVNTYYLLICPTNYSLVETAKLTGRNIDTIVDQLEMYIRV